MHIDLTMKIRDLENKVLVEKVNGVDEPVTLSKVLVGALLNAPDQFAGLSGADKEARFRLACRLATAEVAFEITCAEAELLRNVVGQSFGTLIVGRVYGILDRKSPA